MRTEPKIRSLVSALTGDMKMLEARRYFVEDSNRKECIIRFALEVFCADQICGMEFFQNEQDELTLALLDRHDSVFGYVGINDFQE